jgi:ATP-binding cassette, subfamily B, bacterial PglK
MTLYPLIKYFGEILFLLGTESRKIPTIVALFIAASLLDVAGIGLIGPYVALVIDPLVMEGQFIHIIDWLNLPHDRQYLLVLLSLVLIGIFLFKAISAIFINWVIIKFSVSQRVRLQTYLMQSFQRLNYSEYLLRNSSDYIYSINGLTGHFNTTVMNLLRTTSDCIVGMVILTLLAWSNPLALALLVLLLSSVVIIYDRFFRSKLKVYGKEVNIIAKSVLKVIQEGMEGLKEIRILGIEHYFYSKVRDGTREEGNYQVQMLLINAAPRYILELVIVCFIVILVVGMQKLGHDVNEMLPTLGMFGVAALRLMPMINMISSSLVSLRFGRNSISLLHRDLEYVLKKIDEQSKEENDKYDIFPVKTLYSSNENFHSLKLQNIYFRYNDAKQNVLNGVSLKIEAGESIGIMGASGAGKSTLVDLLLGLLKPQSGQIIINDNPLAENLANRDYHFAYLPQQMFITDNTLRNNIALGVENDEIDNIRLFEALRNARLSELVQQLPQGVDTILGERGIRLSGGQRQRVALARAFYHQRNVLIMDEATSALDDETEQEIQEEIRLLKGRITMVIIAHRLTTVQHCDCIYKLEHGKIISCGPPI